LNYRKFNVVTSNPETLQWVAGSQSVAFSIFKLQSNGTNKTKAVEYNILHITVICATTAMKVLVLRVVTPC